MKKIGQPAHRSSVMAMQRKKLQDKVSEDEDKKTTVVIFDKSNFSGSRKPNCSLLLNGGDLDI